MSLYFYKFNVSNSNFILLNIQMDKKKEQYKKKVFWLLLVIVVVLGIYVVMNPNWVTKPIYMLNPLYCEQDSDSMIQGDTCGATNKYNFEKSQFACEWAICDPSCNQNKCTFSTDCTGKIN